MTASRSASASTAGVSVDGALRVSAVEKEAPEPQRREQRLVGQQLAARLAVDANLRGVQEAQVRRGAQQGRHLQLRFVA